LEDRLPFQTNKCSFWDFEPLRSRGVEFL
jgi:hypothetical protein